MKKIFTSLMLMAFVFVASAQIQLTPVASGTAQGLDENVSDVIENRLRSIISANGMTSGTNSRFVLAARFNVLDKQIIPGPPTKIVTVLEVTLAVGDGFANTCFESRSFEVKGAGNTEQRAILSALKSLKTKNPAISELVANATQRITEYYEKNGPALIKQAQALVTAQDYIKAIDLLAGIPMECSHYNAAVQIINDAYQKEIDSNAASILMEAEAAWAADQTEACGSKVVGLVAQIDPNSSSYPKAQALVKKVGARIQKLHDEALAYERKLEMTKVQNAADLEKQRISAAKSIAVAYAKNQPKVVYKVRHYWW